MLGAIALAIAIVIVIPVGAMMSGAAIAALLGTSATLDAETRYAGSELIDLDS
jgi:hypothetical protein